MHGTWVRYRKAREVWPRSRRLAFYQAIDTHRSRASRGTIVSLVDSDRLTRWAKLKCDNFDWQVTGGTHGRWLWWPWRRNRNEEDEWE